MNYRALRHCAAAFALLLPLIQLSLTAQAAPAAEIRLDAATLDKYAGQYRMNDEPEIKLSFFHDGNSLALEGARIPHTPLHASSQNTFDNGHGMQFTFVTDSTGKVTGVKRVAGKEENEATRVSDQPEHNHFRSYDRKEVMIPVRDGVKLHAIILRPTDTNQPLPIIMQRTPYGVDGYNSNSINAQYTDLARSGYIFVMEDIRGRYGSEGQFFMNRPIVDHHDPKSSDPNNIDETTDAYDTVGWLIKNLPNNNGRVGVVGISYPGFLAIESGIDPNPAVKAISPQAPMTNLWLGDDFFHNGAWRQSYGYDYAIGLETSKENAFSKIDEDAYNFFLDAGSLAGDIKKANVGVLPTWKGFIDHPSCDHYWQIRAVEDHLTKVNVPTLEVGGWWDQEDMWGPQAEYASLKPHDKNNEVFIVLGPWNHGQWSRTTRSLGNVNFGAATGDQFRAQIEAPFFAHYLKDEGTFDLKDAASFQTGTNRWMRYDAWPPKENITERNLYLDADGSLSFDKPTAGDTSFTAYTSDPANPVPYRNRPIEATYAPGGSGWYTWLVQDQKFLGTRKDIATWQTQALDQPVTITGDIVADIFASTSGTDSDWIVKLIDVYPDDSSLGKMSGAQLMIVDEIFRGRYRKSFEHPEAIPADKPEEYKFSLHGADHAFLKGHRIMVQVQSTWFPLYDRNPQTFVPNIMTASPSDYKAATQHIYGSADHPSHIVFPVASGN
ncbi:CocE/NonD family hydrolase [Acidobacterium sp. S8]|uniref:CocE/NonD family hydrolase n=1 Tax=Acidobacterium sp. S8 TaxID=1641854 RepID=UPI0020B107F7|nr:CocE/NonD family hydrolase [Acidobacterium sp. S8]